MTTLSIPVTKAKRTIDVDVDNIPPDVYSAIVAEGLKAFVNRNMSKILTAKLDGEQLKAAQDAAYVAATKNVEAILSGKVRIIGRKASSGKASREVMAEARKLAKQAIKEQMKAADIKISHVPSSEITKAANALLESDPSFLIQAEKNVEAVKAALAGNPTVAVDSAIIAGLKIDPALVAKAEAKKAANKKPGATPKVKVKGKAKAETVTA